MRGFIVTIVVACCSFLYGYYVYPAVNESGIQGGALGPLARDTVVVHDTVDRFRIAYGRCKKMEYLYFGRAYNEKDRCKRSFYDDTASVYLDSVVAILMSAERLR